MEHGSGGRGELLQAILTFEDSALRLGARLAVFYRASDAVDDFAVAPDAKRLTAFVSKSDRLEGRLRLFLGQICDVQDTQRDCR